MRNAIRQVLLLSFAAFLPASAFAQATPANAPAEVTFSSGSLVLHGFLYKPDGKGPFPAILWNHGSERRPGWLPDLSSFFTGHGYIFFIPHRRGQGRSPGEYVMDQLEMAAHTGGVSARSRELVEVMEVQLQDQAAALEYLKKVPEVDS